MKIEITDKHKEIICEALDLYIRAAIGQMDSVVFNRFTEGEMQLTMDNYREEKDRLLLHVEEIQKTVFGYQLHSSKGLYHPKTPASAQIAREIMHVFEGKNRLTKHEPEMKILED
jgi:hypothetical protein